MADVTQAGALERLWDTIDDKRTGMLGICQHGKHMQPMTAFGERETDTIWFYTYRESDLARDIAAGAAEFGGESGDEIGGVKGMFCLDGGDENFFACMSGQMSLERDMTRIEKYWNAVVAAWYPGGKTDARLTMIRFDLDDAQLWLSDKTRLGFMTEVAKANITHQPPDYGASIHVHF